MGKRCRGPQITAVLTECGIMNYIQRLTTAYTYERQMGSIVLTEVSTGKSVFFQCGDDANIFDQEIESLDTRYYNKDINSEDYEQALNSLCSNYF